MYLCYVFMLWRCRHQFYSEMVTFEVNNEIKGTRVYFKPVFACLDGVTGLGRL